MKVLSFISRMVAKLEALPDTNMISAAWRILYMHKLKPSWLDTVPSDVYSDAANKLSMCLYMFVIQIASRPPPGPKIYISRPPPPPSWMQMEAWLPSPPSSLGSPKPDRAQVTPVLFWLGQEPLDSGSGGMHQSI